MGLRESRRGSLGTIPALLQAALFLTVWVAISGGLHLDGLADSASGFGDRERSLAILQGPRSGPIAVVVLLLKFVALVTLLEADAGPLLPVP